MPLTRGVYRSGRVAEQPRTLLLRCVQARMALSGHTETICYSSAFGQQRTYMRSVGRPARSRGCKSLAMKDSYPHRPRVMRSGPRGSRRSVDRGEHRPAIEPRKSLILGADTVHMVEGNTSERVIASAGRPGVVKDPGMCRRSLRGNREISRSTVRQPPPVRIGKARSRSR